MVEAMQHIHKHDAAYAVAYYERCRLLRHITPVQF